MCARPKLDPTVFDIAIAVYNSSIAVQVEQLVQVNVLPVFEFCARFNSVIVLLRSCVNQCDSCVAVLCCVLLFPTLL